MIEKSTTKLQRSNKKRVTHVLKTKHTWRSSKCSSAYFLIDILQ